MSNAICDGHYSIDPILTMVAFEVAIRQAKAFAGKANGKIGPEPIKKDK